MGRGFEVVGGLTKLNQFKVNTVEHIVESYFRLCRKCLTISDAKVIYGNNRQIDLLAVNLKDGSQYHVECSVTHCENWCPTVKQLEEQFERKFSGHPRKREGVNTDFAKGKRYGGLIVSTYEQYGFSIEKIQRIWICWVVKDPVNLQKMLDEYYHKTGFKIAVISFRDVVLPELKSAVGTSNYDDEVLRTFSLIEQADVQAKSAR